MKPRADYLRDKVNIDNYLKNVAKLLRDCLDTALEVEDQKFYSYLNKYLQLTPPEIYPELHQVIASSLKTTYDTLKHMDMYTTTGNLAKLDEYTDRLDDNLSQITGGFFAWIKYLYSCADGDTEYIQVIKSEFPEMYDGLIFED